MRQERFGSSLNSVMLLARRKKYARRASSTSTARITRWPEAIHNPKTKGLPRGSGAFTKRKGELHEPAACLRPSSNRQRCDRDYKSREERAHAEEHQDIVRFGHGILIFELTNATVARRRRSCNHLPVTGLGQY
jgi:hypothetical protein